MYDVLEMWTARRAVVCLLALLLATLPYRALAHEPAQIPDLVEQAIGGVVNISTVSPASDSKKPEKAPPRPNPPKDSPFEGFFKDFFNKQQDKAGETVPKTTKGLGSGFVINESGIIVTANSVVANATDITVFLADGTKLPATILGRDEKTDLALITVSTQEPLKALTFGDSSDVRVGQTIVVIGNPFGLGGTVTSGIISALNRDINAGPYDRFIQTDAAINKGNAGGPLFDLKGEVIGINTSIISPSNGSVGVGFAIPSNLAKDVIAQLKQFGEMRRGWLGVRIQSVTDEIASTLGMKKPSGALVAEVTSGSPAENGGVKAGDVILTFDGRDVANMRALPRIVAATEIGSTVDVRVLRTGKKHALKVTILRLPESSVAQPSGAKTEGLLSTVALLGLTVEELTEKARAKYGISKKVDGVVVTNIESGSAAEKKSIKVGDVVVDAKGKKVTTPAQFSAELNALRQIGRKSVLLLISNKTGDSKFVVVPFSQVPAAPTAGGGGNFDDLEGDLDKLD